MAGALSHNTNLFTGPSFETSTTATLSVSLMRLGIVRPVLYMRDTWYQVIFCSAACKATFLITVSFVAKAQTFQNVFRTLEKHRRFIDVNLI